MACLGSKSSLDLTRSPKQAELDSAAFAACIDPAPALIVQPKPPSFRSALPSSRFWVALKSLTKTRIYRVAQYARDR
jgi:hypothetical protein